MAMHFMEEISDEAAASSQCGSNSNTFLAQAGDSEERLLE
jgi:hypothetical protein